MSTQTDAAPLDAKNMSIANRISLVPLRHTKTVHLIRHAKGFHNVAGEKHKSRYRDPKYMDAHLTECGWEQTRALKNHIASMKPALRVDLVVVSPMTRALETACGIFGNPATSEDDSLLMNAQDSIDDVRSAHGCISSNGSPPLLALESCREYVDSNHPCDRRRSVSYYKLNFPGVDFNQVQSDEDVMWTDGRESQDAFQKRIHNFIDFLSRRSEENIAVVSHSGFLRALCRQFGGDLGEEGREILHKHFANCEMRSVVMCNKFDGSPDVPCSVSQPGGTNTFPSQIIFE